MILHCLGTLFMPHRMFSCRQVAVKPIALIMLVSICLASPLSLAAAAAAPVTAPDGSILIVVSKETTHLTSPLNPDGTVNYVAALNAASRQGATLENDLAIPLMQIFGPQQLPLAIRDAVQRSLGTNLADDLDYDYFKLPTADIDSPETADLVAKARQAVIDAGAEPFTHATSPDPARWYDLQSRHFESLVKASARDRYYIPLISPDSPPRLASATPPLVGSLRTAVLTLQGQAMLRTGENDLKGAAEDLQAAQRLAALMARGYSSMALLMSLAAQQQTFTACLTIARSENATADTVKTFLANIDALPPTPSVAEVIDSYERYVAQDYISDLQSQRTYSHLAAQTAKANVTNQLFLPDGRPISIDAGEIPDVPLVVDFNSLLKNVDAQYDRLIAALKLTPYAKRIAAVKQLDNEINGDNSDNPMGFVIDQGFWKDYRQMTPADQRTFLTRKLTTSLTRTFLTPLFRAAQYEDIARMRLQLTRVALALEIHHLEKNTYPQNLSALAPAYLKQIPADFFIDKPLHYIRAGKGYVLYSVGLDQADNEGDPNADLVASTP